MRKYNLILSLILVGSFIGCTNTMSGSSVGKMAKPLSFADGASAAEVGAEASTDTEISGAEVYVSPFGKKRDVKGMLKRIFFEMNEKICKVNLNEGAVCDNKSDNLKSYHGATHYIGVQEVRRDGIDPVVMKCASSANGTQCHYYCLNSDSCSDGPENIFDSSIEPSLKEWAKNKKISKIIRKSNYFDYYFLNDLGVTLISDYEEGVERNHRYLFSNPADVFIMQPEEFGEYLCIEDNLITRCFWVLGANNLNLDKIQVQYRFVLPKKYKYGYFYGEFSSVEIMEIQNDSLAYYSLKDGVKRPLSYKVSSNLHKPEFIFNNSLILDNEGLKRFSVDHVKKEFIIDDRIFISRDKIGKVAKYYRSNLNRISGHCFKNEIGLRCFNEEGIKTIEFLNSDYGEILDYREIRPYTGGDSFCVLTVKGEYCSESKCKFKDIPDNPTGETTCSWAWEPFLKVRSNTFYHIKDHLGEFLKLSPLSKINLIYDSIEFSEKSNIPVHSSSSYLLHRLLQPTLTSIDSKAVAEKLRDGTDFDIILKKMEAVNEISNINQVEATEINRKIAVMFLTTSTETAFEFLSLQDRAQLQNLVRLLGQANANLMDNAVLKSLIQEFKNQKSIFDKLTSSTKSKFLVDTIDQTLAWLEAKI